LKTARMALALTAVVKHESSPVASVPAERVMTSNRRVGLLVGLVRRRVRRCHRLLCFRLLQKHMVELLVYFVQTHLRRHRPVCSRLLLKHKVEPLLCSCRHHRRQRLLLFPPSLNLRRPPHGAARRTKKNAPRGASSSCVASGAASGACTSPLLLPSPFRTPCSSSAHMITGTRRSVRKSRRIGRQTSLQALLLSRESPRRFSEARYYTARTSSTR